jgi:hypothetical protein
MGKIGWWIQHSMWQQFYTLAKVSYFHFVLKEYKCFGYCRVSQIIIRREKLINLYIDEDKELFLSCGNFSSLWLVRLAGRAFSLLKSHALMLYCLCHNES